MVIYFYIWENQLINIMKIKLTFYLLCLLITSLVTGQSGIWDVIQQIPSVNLRGICILDDGLHGFSAGSEWDDSGDYLSVFYKTSDGGDSWESNEINLSLNSEINGIFFIDENIGWIAGDNGLLIKTINGGETFQYLSSGTNRDIAKVQFLDENTGYATGGWSDGSQFLVLRSDDGGDTWQNISFGSDAFSCLDLCFIDDQTGWICGHDSQLNPHIHKTADAGQTWVRQNVPLSANNVGISSIDFADNNDGWATVTSIYLNPPGALLHTTDGGDNWVLQNNTNLHYNYLDVMDGDNIAIIGFTLLGGANEKLFTSDDGGVTLSSAVPPIARYTEGIKYLDGKIWISSDKSTILSTENKGDDWLWESISPALSSISWQTQQSGWSSSGSGSGADNFAYLSEDAGVSWNLAQDVPGGSQVFWINDQVGWMLWIGTNAKIWRTTDGGENWNQYNIGSSSYLEKMFFVSEDIGWVFGSNGALRKTTNGGMTWMSQYIGVSEFVAAAHFIDESEGWTAGGYGGGNGFIAHTTDGGETWEQQFMIQYDHILDLYFLDENLGWATAVGGRVHVTSNGGETWDLAGQVNDDYADEIIMADPQNGWMITSNAGNSGLGSIYYTNDGGYSWIVDYQGELPFSIMRDLNLKSDGTLWACGYHSTILKYSETVGIPETGEEENILNLEVYPNPVRGKVNIIGDVKDNSTVDLHLINTLGVICQTWQDIDLSGGNISLDINNDIIGGIYLIEVVSNSERIFMKILIKEN